MHASTSHSLPLVSCLCITFARPKLLQEAIQSFLNQDYLGEKELVILNDFHAQTLRIEHPEISVINLPYKVNTLGEKRNMVAALSKGDVLFPWDDDDVSLPFRLSQSVKQLNTQNVEYYKPKTAFVWNNGIIDRIFENSFHAQCCYTRELFNKTLYRAMGSGEDQAFDTKVAKITGRDIASIVGADENFYLYRWAGTGSYHISDYGDEDPEAQLLAYQSKEAEMGNIITGEIDLNPSWQVDYVELARDFIAGLERD